MMIRFSARGEFVTYRTKPMGSARQFKRVKGGFAYNEGGGPFNFLISLNRPKEWLFAYIFLMGRSWVLSIPRKGSK